MEEPQRTNPTLPPSEALVGRRDPSWTVRQCSKTLEEERATVLHLFSPTLFFLFSFWGEREKGRFIIRRPPLSYIHFKEREKEREREREGERKGWGLILCHLKRGREKRKKKEESRKDKGRKERKRKELPNFEAFSLSLSSPIILDFLLPPDIKFPVRRGRKTNRGNFFFPFDLGRQLMRRRHF